MIEVASLRLLICCVSSNKQQLSNNDCLEAKKEGYHIQAQHAFTGFVRFEESIVCLTLSPQKHWYMPSSHPVLMAAMPCWPGRRKPPLIVFSVC